MSIQQIAEIANSLGIELSREELESASEEHKDLKTLLVQFKRIY